MFPERKNKVVTVGGGTGHFMLLSVLKQMPVEVTAIVSMADDGGSSGVLRDELGVLPPGDVRQCLAALSEESAVIRELFNYRFSEGGMRGHSFGNIFLSALEKVTGSFPEAVKEAGKILAVKGRVLPVTKGDMRLIIQLKNGTKLAGERFLDASEEVRTIGVEKISLLNQVEAEPDAVRAIDEADFIILGPGDLYGSTLPPILVPGIASAVRDTGAKIIYISNLTNKRGQTNGFTVDDYAHVIHEYIGSHCIDIVLCNNERPAPHLLSFYEAQEGKDMLVGCNEKAKQPYRKYTADLLSQESPMFLPQDSIGMGGARSFIRHEPTKLKRVLEQLLQNE